MALTDQPYLPLYVDDWMNNSKLKLCSPGAHGLMISIMCLMHKSESYGMLSLKAKFKQNSSNLSNFAIMLAKLTSFELSEINAVLSELIENEVLIIRDDIMICNRMVKDFSLSSKRAEAGSVGGKKRTNSHTKKLYNEPGFVYVIKDFDQNDVFKIGISKNPEKRLVQVTYTTGRKNLRLIKTIHVSDMGSVEDNILLFFENDRDGEWIYGVPEEKILSELQKYSSKTQANTGIENGTVIENEIEDVLKNGLDEIYLNQERMKWPKIDFNGELESFRNKVRGSPQEYSGRDSAGIRLAFQYQLRNAKPKINGTTKNTASAEIIPGKRDFKRTW